LATTKAYLPTTSVWVPKTDGGTEISSMPKATMRNFSSCSWAEAARTIRASSVDEVAAVDLVSPHPSAEKRGMSHASRFMTVASCPTTRSASAGMEERWIAAGRLGLSEGNATLNESNREGEASSVVVRLGAQSGSTVPELA
jgi:hypothetical protein